MKKLHLCLVLSAGILSTLPVLTQAKTATCQIEEGGRMLYKGQCNFEPQGQGSFYISHPSFPKKVAVSGIFVKIEAKNRAIVEGTKVSGGGSIWGEAVRSSQQKACWIGTENSFKICAW